MSTTQSADPDEKIDHPRHYNQHPSNIECIELIEHLTCNFGNAVKYIWRCGLKVSETPKRDIGSARWYTTRERARILDWGLTGADQFPPKTDAHVARLISRVIESSAPEGTLARYLRGLLRLDFDQMFAAIDDAEAALPSDPVAKSVGITRQRDALWALLDNIDTLDDACREDDAQFRKLSRKHLQKRFEIHNPDDGRSA